MDERALEVKRLREERKAAKRERRKQKGLPEEPAPPTPLPPPKPLSRSFQRVPYKRKLANLAGHFTVMTYNILAQALIKRELFPHSGDLLKWKTRRKMVMDEITMYKPDILCLQEVDMYEEFYESQFSKLGYKTLFYKHSTKKHGCMIGYQAGQFTLAENRNFDYDTDDLCPVTQNTGNIMQLAALKHVHQQHLGVVVGNTHLYWRPQSSYERLRQGAIYNRKLSQFRKELAETHGQTQWHALMLGDFNSTPTDPLYAKMVGLELTDFHMQDLQMSRRAFSQDEDETSVSAFADRSEEEEQEPRDDLIPVDELLSYFKDIPKWKSVYQCYAQLDNSMSDGLGEPRFTNYAEVFQGTLDYIFVEDTSVTLAASEILMLPKEDDLKPALPNKNYGSDHLCLLAKLDFGE
ncbi:Endonuclease/exonuclease/phosphatase [Radiomyces spectabilis]|uniref:Endonuclease/exonuclease/phosphatase n=1 Tax=Radiomyces spectabilis TaxID=64574 RepID=UPI00221E753E|nr:Endonuclease/exonuclease/phosphatase [Radiomyces spectabilis]KAI8388307.1 Endonuclease/exonuclease/phosphatase [Radiomyces spectabilis]